MLTATKNLVPPISTSRVGHMPVNEIGVYVYACNKSTHQFPYSVH